jgi:hypothetical protein
MSFSDADHEAPLCEAELWEEKEVSLLDWHGTLVASCTSGNGDGAYPLLVARDPEGWIIAAEVLFDWIEDDDDDE